MMSQEEEKDFRAQLEKMGADEVERKLKLNHYGAQTTPRHRVAQHFVDQARAKERRELEQKALTIQTESNEIAREANQKSDEANKLSKEANQVAKSAKTISIIAVIVSVIAMLIGVYLTN